MVSVPTRLAEVKGQANTAAAIFTGTTGHLYLFKVQVTCTGLTRNAISLWIAANSWTTGTPSGSTLVATLCKDLWLNSYETIWLPSAVLSGTEKIVAVTFQATSVLDLCVFGTDET